MMNTTNLLSIVATCTLLLSSCGKKGCTDPSALNFDQDAEKHDGSCEYPDILEDSTNLYLRIHHQFGSEDLDLNSAYQIPGSEKINVSLFKYYLSNIGSTNEEFSEIEYINLAELETTTLGMTAKPGSYSSLDFSVGVPNELNQADPAIYPANHPLSSLNGTYWTWSTQYRFILIEGKADTAKNNTYDLSYIYHTGIDTCFRSRSIPMSYIVPEYGESITVDLYFDMEKFWNGSDTIRIKTETTTHTTDDMPLALKVSDAFIASFSAE
jgi:hypothetical protein